MWEGDGMRRVWRKEVAIVRVLGGEAVSSSPRNN